MNYFTDYYIWKGVTVLPTLNGYIVDMQLRKFRRMEHGDTLRIVPFASERGEQLLKRLIQVVPKGSRLWSEVLTIF